MTNNAVFKPNRVFFEKAALDYELGKKLYDLFSRQGIDIHYTGTHNRITGIPGSTPQESYRAAKETLVVGVRKTLDFQSCKPSAHYQLPLVTSCPGKCEYCYLATTLGKKPYVRVYVNTDAILDRAQTYINQRAPETTLFEGSATSDPIPLEPYTGSLGLTVKFFAHQELGRFRFVTKFTDVDSLLELEHNGHTTFRFSINTDHVINEFEHGTPRLHSRLQAASKVSTAGYPLGFLIAPIIIYDGWEKDYQEMLGQLAKSIPSVNLTFELISHRYTLAAKKRILDIFPGTKLPMQEETRSFKFGQFGYGKYVYTKHQLEQMESFLRSAITQMFPSASILYLV
ncbi:MAG: spore photoproduct lyase [Bacillota bacterium]